MVEDDPNVSDVVGRYLRREGFEVETVADGVIALELALATPPDLLVVDVMLPRLDGLQLVEQLRATSPVPVIFLTARGDEEDRVAGLELGADDYISKPFSVKELVARVKAVLRRATGELSTSPPTTPDRLIDGDLDVDVPGRRASRAGDDIGLTAREFELLVFLMTHAGRALRRDELLEEVWGYSYGDTSTVTVHMRRLREKIESDPRHPARIATVWGVGYRWEGTP